MNMLATGFAGVLFGHYGLGAAMSAQLVLNAMLAPLGATVLACFLKNFP